MGSLAKPNQLINLQLGWPSPRLFAASALLEGANEVLTSSSETAAALIYGPHHGHPPLRQSIADWLSSLYPTPSPTTPDRICVSNGASANLSNVLQKFTDPIYTRRIFMVEPTYFLACPIFEDNGFRGKLKGVPEDNDEGLDIEYLKNELRQAEDEAVTAAKANGSMDAPVFKTGPTYPKIFKYIIYLVPTFSNPSGKTLSLQMRKELVKVARQYDALVISDDVYDFLSWPEDQSALAGEISPPLRLVDVDREMDGYSDFGNTLSNGSFSKIIGPGVRVGWAECTPSFVRELAEVGSSSSGGAPSHLTSTFVDKMLRTNRLQDHIKNTLIPTYRQRYYVLLNAIKDLLIPLGVTIDINKPKGDNVAIGGGFFTYLRLPKDLPMARTVAAFLLREVKLRVAFGHMFVVAGDEGSVTRAENESEGNGGFARCIRLCWAWHEEEELTEGITRFADGIKEIRRRIAAGESLGDVEGIGIR